MAPPASWLRREVFVGLALGQFVSLLITSTGFSSSELARRGVNAPTSQSLLNYILLALIYGGVLIHKRRHLTIKWYYYLILGIIDVEANYIVVKAYQYTSLTSVMLIDCWSIPCVILLTWVFLKTKYGLRKFIGVGVCMAGIVLVVFSDVHASERAREASTVKPLLSDTLECLAEGPNPLKGDLLVVAGATLYAVSNVTEEYFVKKSNRVEVMAMLDSSLHRVCTGNVLVLLDSTYYTQDMWRNHAKSLAPDLRHVDWMYFVAFAGTAAGLIIYSYKGSKEIAEETAQVTGAMDEEAAAVNHTKLVPGVGEIRPASNKEFTSAATASS
ncbi:hypothetical protein EJB05_42168, partial [Eragrostis curvula]